jgi:hypothetical protein
MYIENIKDKCINIHLKVKDRKVKRVLFSGGMGEGRVNREVEGGQIWWIHFVYLYENRTMKLF